MYFATYEPLAAAILVAMVFAIIDPSATEKIFYAALRAKIKRIE